jgi:hypothetical protein
MVHDNKVINIRGEMRAFLHPLLVTPLAINGIHAIGFNP